MLKINSISPNWVDPWTNSTNIVGFAYAAAPFWYQSLDRVGSSLDVKFWRFWQSFISGRVAWSLSGNFPRLLGVCLESNRDLKILILIELLGIGLEKFQTFPENAWRFKSGRESFVEFWRFHTFWSFRRFDLKTLVGFGSDFVVDPCASSWYQVDLDRFDFGARLKKFEFNCSSCSSSFCNEVWSFDPLEFASKFEECWRFELVFGAKSCEASLSRSALTRGCAYNAWA